MGSASCTAGKRAVRVRCGSGSRQWGAVNPPVGGGGVWVVWGRVGWGARHTLLLCGVIRQGAAGMVTDEMRR